MRVGHDGEENQRAGWHCQAMPAVCGCVQVDTCDKSSRYSDISQKGKHRRPEQCEQHPGSINLDCEP